MSYQPPGQYPVAPMPPVYGMPPQGRPPIPQAALRSYYAILAGGALSAVSIIIGLSTIGSIRSQLRDQLGPKGFGPDTINTFINVEIALIVVFGIIGILLWLWMAWKIKTGRHWARVLSSVFFGLEFLSTLVGGINYRTNETTGDETTSASVHQSAAVTILGWVIVAVGLYALVMFWHKSNAAFFHPEKAYAPAGYPYPYPPQGYPSAQYPQGYPQPQYPQAQYPQVPDQGGAAPQQGAPQQPNDPWSTPPQ